MPTTARGIIYPDSSGHTRLWEHLQDLATTTDDAIQRSGRLIGEMVLWPAAAIPTHWLLCDGAAIPAQYVALINLIGPNTPDMRDRVPVGAAASKALGSAGGAATRVLLPENLPPHAHTINHNHANRVADGTGARPAYAPRATDNGTSDAGNTVIAHNGNSGNGPGTSTPVNVQNPYRALNYIIRATF